MLALDGIGFRMQPNADPLLSGITTILPEGHFGAVVGPSGCGKSTLLKVIAGILPNTEGKIYWQGRNLEENDLPPHELGYVPQFSCTHPRLTVEENILFSARLRQQGSPEDLLSTVDRVATETGLKDLLDRRAGVLSGGQLRRLALAMELTTRPSLLLADEVTSGLDPKSEEEITILLRALAREQGRLVLLVTHSLRLLGAYDSITVLTGGRLAYSASPKEAAHYFQVPAPEDIYPALTARQPADWALDWLSAPEAKDWIPENIDSMARGRGSKSSQDEEPPLPGFLAQTLSWFTRRCKLFLRDPAQVFLQASLLFIFPALVTVFAYRGLPSVRNMAMGIDTGIVDQLKETLNFTVQSSRIGTLVSGLAMFQVILLALMGSNNSAREVVGERAILEKEKLAGLRPTAALLGMVLFLSILVVLQSAWMTLFVRAVCQFPGNPLAQFLPFLLLSAAITALCLAISSWTSTAEQSSLGSLYLVGFQLPLSGAILALPDFLGQITRPLIGAYWAWSGYLQTLRDTRFYDLVKAITETPLSNYALCLWMLLLQLGLGLFLAYFGIRRSLWR